MNVFKKFILISATFCTLSIQPIGWDTWGMIKNNTQTFFSNYWKIIGAAIAVPAALLYLAKKTYWKPSGPSMATSQTILPSDSSAPPALVPDLPTINAEDVIRDAEPTISFQPTTISAAPLNVATSSGLIGAGVLTNAARYTALLNTLQSSNVEISDAFTTSEQLNDIALNNIDHIDSIQNAYTILRGTSNNSEELLTQTEVLIDLFTRMLDFLEEDDRYSALQAYILQLQEIQNALIGQLANQYQ